MAEIPPHHDGLQFCAHLTAGELAPHGSTHVFVHSISAYISTDNPAHPALAAISGRYPGWNTPGTTIYNQQFTNTNTVWLEILHEFPFGIACIEVYGKGLRPSHYAAFKNRILVSYSYMPAHGPGVRTQKFIPFHRGPYLPRYSPRRRPRH